MNEEEVISISANAEFIKLSRLLNKAQKDMQKALRGMNSAHKQRVEAAKQQGSGSKSRGGCANSFYSSKHDSKQNNYKLAVEKHEVAASNYDKALADYTYLEQKFKSYVLSFYGVPKRHRNNVFIRRKPNGITDIFFGGTSGPLGDGHGHYVINRNGKLVCRIEQGERHLHRENKKGEVRIHLVPATQSLRNIS